MQEEAIVLQTVASGVFTLHEVENTVSLDDVHRVHAINCFNNYSPDENGSKDNDETIDMRSLI